MMWAGHLIRMYQGCWKRKGAEMGRMHKEAFRKMEREQVLDMGQYRATTERAVKHNRN